MNFLRFNKRDGIPLRVAEVGNSLLGSLKFLSPEGRADSITDFPGDLGRTCALRAATQFVRAVGRVSPGPAVVQPLVHPSLRALPAAAKVPSAAGLSKNSVDDVLYFGGQESVELVYDRPRGFP